MYRQSYQRGMLSIFYSVGSKPLALWDTHTQDGYISRFLDHDIKSMVLEIGGTNVSTTYMICPKGSTVLGITMPFLVMIVKNLKKYFSFEVTVLDATGTRRRFRVSNFQSSTQVLPLCTVMPISLSEGWNQIQFNLAEFTRRAYKIQFVETQKIKVNANIRIRRIYFAERIMPEDELPPEYKLYFPLIANGPKERKAMTLVKDKATPAPTVEDEKKSSAQSTPAKNPSKQSVESIKRPSQKEDPITEESDSKILPIEESKLERSGAATKVPFDTSGKTSQTTIGENNEDPVELVVPDQIVVQKEADDSLNTVDTRIDPVVGGYEGDGETDASAAKPEETEPEE